MSDPVGMRDEKHTQSPSSGFPPPSSSTPPVHSDPEAQTVYDDEKKSKTSRSSLHEGLATDELGEPFVYEVTSGLPLPDVADSMPVETQTLTVRALVVGCALGSIVQASNLYLGLKTGFTFGPQLFGAIMGFVVLKAISKVRWFGGYFGEKENVTVQTAATAAGGLGIIFVSGIPAMYQLGLLSKTAKEDFGKLLGLTFICAFYGMSFAIPLRKWYILKQKLVFPTPSATGLTIRALHSGPSGLIVAKKKGIALAIAFTVSVLLRVISGYAPGVLWDWHPFWWLASWGWRSVIGADNWGFYWEHTPAFYGAGIITGLNASLSMWAGGIVAWGIIGPILQATGTTVSRDFSEDYQGYPVQNYNLMAFADPRGKVSPRYWILWPGVFFLLVVSFAEFAVEGGVIFKGFKNVYEEFRNTLAARRGKPPVYEVEPAIPDPAKPHEQVPFLWWGSLGAISVIVTVVVLSEVFNVNAGLGILSIVLGFVFSFIGVLCSGSTDINPISTVAKTSQIVFGGATHGKYTDSIVTNPTTGISHNIKALRINLLAGIVSGAAAAQTTDMTGDLKTGHLLKASPRNQFVAQGIGAICSCFLATGLFVLFTQAYPCILDPTAATCQFGIPSVAAWSAVAQAVTSTNGLPLPTSSAVFSLILGIAGVIITVVKKHYVPERHRKWFPNLMAFGLSFTLPPGQSQYGLAMAASSTLAYFWKKRNPIGYDLYAFPIAAGMMAGEGIGGVINAVLVIAEADGALYGTSAGCPGRVFCG